MELSKLLEGVHVTKMFQTMFGRMVVTHDIEVRQLQYDSRKVEKSDAFVAIRGTAFDGHRFIDDAVNRGAKVVVVEDDAVRPDSFFMHAGVVKVVVPDARRALAGMSANFYGHPSRKLRLVGVTGTNGKTTTAYLIASLLEKAGLIGTIEYRIGHDTYPATHTTPESLEMNAFLADMVRQGCDSAVMEVSSHALHQHRVGGLEFEVAVFTNLTQDHLDYHGTMEGYSRAKKSLFDGLDAKARAITNVDDDYGMNMVLDCKAGVVTYGEGRSADVRATNVQLAIAGTRLSVVHKRETTVLESRLIGKFNVYNLLAGFATGLALGLTKQELREKIGQFSPVRGRFERIVTPAGFTVIIDYAHTPDALKNCLEAIHTIMTDSRNHGRVITVFGCGGNRDRGKRPKMGRIASELSDVTIITSDNPRMEDPHGIIREVAAGVVHGSVVHQQPDRREAIRQALHEARQGDVVLVAGKGHETYQVVGDEKIPFSDHAVVDEVMHSLSV